MVILASELGNKDGFLPLIFRYFNNLTWITYLKREDWICRLDLILMVAHSAGSSCRNLGSDVPIYMQPIEAGQLLSLMIPNSLPPALSPIPPLTVSDVVEPPLPSVSRSVAPGAAPPSLQPSSGQRDAVPLLVSVVTTCGFLLLV